MLTFRAHLFLQGLRSAWRRPVGGPSTLSGQGAWDRIAKSFALAIGAESVAHHPPAHSAHEARKSASTGASTPGFTWWV